MNLYSFMLGWKLSATLAILVICVNVAYLFRNAPFWFSGIFAAVSLLVIYSVLITRFKDGTQDTPVDQLSRSSIFSTLLMNSLMFFLLISSLYGIFS